MELLYAVIGALLGTFFTLLLPKVVELYNKASAKAIKKRKALLESNAIYKWLIDYYTSKGSLNDLYCCNIGSYETRIPILTKPEWAETYINLLEGEDLIAFAYSDRPPFEVNQKLITKRQRLGQRLFNEPTIYVDRIENREGQPKIHVKTCDYFQMFTLLANLEEETFRSVNKQRFHHTPIRDELGVSFEQMVRITKRPLSVGCQVAVALRVPTGFETIIQTRSHSTITFGGAKAIIPSYGLYPPPRNSDLSKILFYNFIKEYCEELFNYDELITLDSSKRADPNWFYELSEAQVILKLIEQNKLTFECLGIGFDALNGSLTLALFVLIDDISTSQSIKQGIITNWEVAERTHSVVPIEFINFDSHVLEVWLREKKYHFGGAFALARAIDRLSALKKA